MGSGFRRALRGFDIPVHRYNEEDGQIEEALRVHPLGYEGDDGKKSLEPMTHRERFLYNNGGRAAVLEERGFNHREKHKNQADCIQCVRWRTNGETNETATMVPAPLSERGEDRQEDQPQGQAPGIERQGAAPRNDVLPTVRVPTDQGRAASTETAQTVGRGRPKGTRNLKPRVRERGKDRTKRRRTK